MANSASQDSFGGQTVIVTGGGGVLGRALCLAFIRQGANVHSFDIKPASFSSDELASSPGRILSESLDVTDSQAVAKAFAHVAAASGIDILVNVAGVVSFGSFLDIAPEEFSRVLDINLKGTLFCCQSALPSMLARGFGRIVNFGSVVGKNGGNARPWIDPAESARAGNAAYGCSKAAVHALTYFLAKEFSHRGVTSNAIAPGPIATTMTTNFPEALRALIPAQRMGTTDDVCTATLFLCSRAASFISGEVLDVNGALFCDLNGGLQK